MGVEYYTLNNGFKAEFNDNEIKGFFGEYRYLSNYELVPIQYEGITYPATENAFQAAKTILLDQRKGFELISPLDAKKLGRKVKMRDHWDNIKNDIMLNLTRQKYSNNPELAAKLKQTGNKYLEETNYWNDTYWGVCEGIGHNYLGSILMQVRDELIARDK